MSIKKSLLEQKWYYRVVKIIFLWVPPLLVVVGVFVLIFVDVRGTGKDVATVLQNDSSYIIYAVAGLILYYLILRGVWRGFLYIVFGGLEDDMKKKSIETGDPVVTAPGVSALTPSDKNQIVGWILTLIALGCIYYVYFIYKSPAPIHINNITTPSCVSTGCGTGWWCSGSYYIGGQEINVPGLCYPTNPRNVYSSWSGTCRQCP